MLRLFCRLSWKRNSLAFPLSLLLICAIPTLGNTAAVDPDKPEIKYEKTVRIDLENGFNRYFYYTRYRIGGKIISRDGLIYTFFPISELRFPLDVFTLYADLNLTFVDRITFHYNARKNIQNYVGKMKDSDWIAPGFTGIYSESDTRLNAVFTDADLIIRLFTKSFFSLKFGLGFLHEYMYFRCSNVEQKDLIPGDTPYIKIFGRALTYEVQYYMPTIRIIPVFTILGGFEIAVAIRFSPYLWAKDIDDHLLRAKRSTSATTGFALLPGIKMKYLFANRIFVSAALEYLYLETKGKQTQSYYLPVREANNIPGWSAKLDNRLRSEQVSVSLGAGYAFEF